MDAKKPKLGSAVIVVHDGKILLGLRNKKNANNLWVLPGGGVEWGEKISDAAIREIKEETNLDIELEKFIGFEEIINIPGDYHTIVFFHTARPLHTDIKVSDDISDAKFFTLEEIRNLPKVESVENALRKAKLWK